MTALREGDCVEVYVVHLVPFPLFSESARRVRPKNAAGLPLVPGGWASSVHRGAGSRTKGAPDVETRATVEVGSQSDGVQSLGCSDVAEHQQSAHDLEQRGLAAAFGTDKRLVGGHRGAPISRNATLNT